METGLESPQEGKVWQSGLRCCCGSGSERHCSFLWIPTGLWEPCMAAWYCLPIDVESAGRGLTSPEVVLCCGRDDACPAWVAPLTKLVPDTAGTSTGVAIWVRPARRWSRALLMWASWVVVSQSCWESSLIWWLSLADCSSCWLSLVDSTAREHSVDPPVVIFSHSGHEWCCLFLGHSVWGLRMLFCWHLGCIVYHSGLGQSWQAQQKECCWPFQTTGQNFPGLVCILFGKR